MLSWVLWLVRVRFLRLTAPNRIGHISLEIDAFVKAGTLGRRPKMLAVLIAPPSATPNTHLAKCWRRHLAVVLDEQWAARLRPFMAYSYLVFDTHRYVLAIDSTAEYVAIQHEWEPRPALLGVATEDQAWGAERLAALGVPTGAWFVCMHSREGGYSPEDEHLHRFRNSDISSYLEAAAAIRARGGWCVRMGDPSMKPLPAIDGLVDYAHSPLRDPRMDVFLCATCRFFLGNTSGLFLVSCVFGVPAIMANAVPLSMVLPFGSADIGVPKLIRRKADGRILPFWELFSTPVANYRFAELYENGGLEVVDNTPEEIRDVALEMLDRLEGKIRYSPEDEALESAFKALMKPGHYTYGSASRVGRDFLREHRDLVIPMGA